MGEPGVEEKLRLLRSLLTDYSYPEMRCPNMLREIDSLCSWAMSEVIRVGSNSSSVKEALGSPHIVIGEESSETFRWLYPCFPTEQEAARTPQWFFSLQFRHRRLQSIERRGWVG